MKNIMQALLLPTMLFIFLTGCKKESASTAVTSGVDPAVVTSGVWSVSSFTQRTENKTSLFNGVNFSFSSDGKITATGTSSANGIWMSAPASAGYYGSPGSVATFTINLGTQDPFSKISKTWNVSQMSGTLLKLDNREAAEDEHLVFIKK